jgi:hypothetical protein
VTYEGSIEGEPETVTEEALILTLVCTDDNTGDEVETEITMPYGEGWAVLGEMDFVTASPLNAGETGSPYDDGDGLEMADPSGQAPLHFTVASGDFPDGLSLNETTGAITGEPTVADTFVFTVKCADSTVMPEGSTMECYSVQKEYTIVITEP